MLSAKYIIWLYWLVQNNNMSGSYIILSARWLSGQRREEIGNRVCRVEGSSPLVGPQFQKYLTNGT